jgi:hypothetical protein
LKGFFIEVPLQAKNLSRIVPIRPINNSENMGAGSELISPGQRKIPMRSRFSVTIALLVCVALMTVGCSVSPKSPKRQTNKTAGGSFTGKTISKEIRKRALKESGIRTLSFGSVSAYMDYQETKLRQRLKRTGVRISRAGHNIILTMPGNITFDLVRPT